MTNPHAAATKELVRLKRDLDKLTFYVFGHNDLARITHEITYNFALRKALDPLPDWQPTYCYLDTPLKEVVAKAWVLWASAETWLLEHDFAAFMPMFAEARGLLMAGTEMAWGERDKLHHLSIIGGRKPDALSNLIGEVVKKGRKLLKMNCLMFYVIVKGLAV